MFIHLNKAFSQRIPFFILKPKQTTIKNKGRFSVANQRGVGEKKPSGEKKRKKKKKAALKCLG